MQQNAQIQGLVLGLVRQNCADRKETNDRFYQLLDELRWNREEQTHKWEKYIVEQNRKWEDVKHEFDRMHEAIMTITKKYTEVLLLLVLIGELNQKVPFAMRWWGF